jgi:hypothetical protein
MAAILFSIYFIGCFVAGIVFMARVGLLSKTQIRGANYRESGRYSGAEFGEL